MKLKFRLSIIVIIILVVVVAGISVILLIKASDMAKGLAIESVNRLAREEAMFIQGRENGYLRVAIVTAAFMGAFEDAEPELRRERFNQFLRATLDSEPNLVGIFAVFKPNVLDGMDDQYRGATGCTAEGIYAPWFSQESGQIVHMTYDNVPVVIDLLTGPDSRKQTLRDPEARTIAGKATYVFRIGVPIINKRNNEVVGLVGIMIAIDALQPLVEQTIKDNNDIAAMAIYSANGTIMASYQADRIGKNVREADKMLYSPRDQEAADAVTGGKAYQVNI
jgi:methyl-accepting chemotaxis protein